MPDYQGHRRLLFFIVAVLFVLTAGVVFVKVRFLDFSLNDRSSVFYQLDASVSFQAVPGQPVHLSLALPELTPGYYFSLVPEGKRNFQLTEEDGDRRAVLNLPPTSGRQTVNCRFRVVPGTVPEPVLPPPPEGFPVLPDATAAACDALLAKIDPGRRLPPEELVPVLLRELAAIPPAERKLLSGSRAGGEGTLAAAITVLERRGLHARLLRGISLDDRRLQQLPVDFLDLYFDGTWHVFRANTGKEGLPEGFLILQRGGKSLFELSGGTHSAVRYSVTRVPTGAETLNRIRSRIIGERNFPNLTLFALPAGTQNMFQKLALLPLAILLIVVARNIVGIPTMGTFMPVLIAMAFLEMKLLPGIICFLLILTVGLAIRFWLSKLNLLMVPRISAVVVVVILLMQLISMVANGLQLRDFMAVTFFPLIIIAWTIERASTIWEEDGARNTLMQLGASLAIAAVCYLILSNSYLQYLLYTFSELNLAILGVILLLGTYTGYRVSELIRFQPLVKP